MKDNIDITREKDGMLAAIVNSSENAIVSETLEGIITSWNPAATRMFGYTENEAIGKHISLIIPPDRLYEETMIIQTIRTGKKIEHFETVRVAKDGTERNVSLTLSPVRNHEGKIIGASKIARDISLKKEVEEKQATLAAIVNSSDDAIISKTLDGIITSWNPAATRMFGYTENEAIGKHISLIIPPERLHEEKMIIGSIRNGEKIDHFETIRKAKDGAERNISLTISPVKNNEGKIIGASKIARDISVKIAAEKQRELYIERVQELSKYKDDFMAMASHELKTPLTVILANLQILQQILAADTNRIFVDKSVNQALKLSDLITNLLDVSKIQAGKLELKTALFNLNPVVRETVKDLQQTTKKHKLLFNESAEELMVNADPDRIQQVLVNLLSNAIKYTPLPGDIIIKAYKKDGNIIVSVCDTGIGIPKKDIENIFLRFYRVSGPASSFSGSGIGLFISSEIIKAHHGSIWAESRIGKGSVFYFSIPAQAVQARNGMPVSVS
jgi:PAS domain S-box-containing protein